MNELEITFRLKQTVSIPDKRYRVLITLVRADRPRYWNFLCNNCGSKVVEIQNYDIVDMIDFFDPQNINNSGIGRHCKGLDSNGSACQFTYFFNLA